MAPPIRRFLPIARLACALCAAAATTGCATATASVRFAAPGGGAGEEVSIPGLLACDTGVQSATIDPHKPIHVLVHGCNSSTAKFKTLAQVFAARGQQAVCFSYDDRDYLERSSALLTQALDLLQQHMQSRDVVVLGHSQGGLVTRKALIKDRRDGVHFGKGDFQVRLVTISSPFAGIQSSRHCGSVLGYVLSLGITPGVCQLIAGAKWREIFPGAGFLRTPGALVDNVTDHLKIDTDEQGACREFDKPGRCAKSDFVFGLGEQDLDAVDSDGRVEKSVVRSGHVEIVGESGEPPLKLIAILQERGILAPTPPGEEHAFAALLDSLYR